MLLAINFKCLGGLLWAQIHQNYHVFRCPQTRRDDPGKQDLDRTQHFELERPLKKIWGEE